MTNERTFRRWKIKCPVCGEEIRDWDGKSPGVRDTEPRDVMAPLLRHLAQHPEVIGRLDLDQGCPVCGKEIPGKVRHRKGSSTMRTLAPAMRWSGFAAHYAAKHPDRVGELLERLELPPVEPVPVELPASALGGLPKEDPREELPPAPEEVPEPEELPAPVETPEPTGAVAPAGAVGAPGPTRTVETPAPVAPGPQGGEEEDVERKQLSDVFPKRMSASHGDREEIPGPEEFPDEPPRRPFPSHEEEKEEKGGRAWWKWGLVGAAGLAGVGLLFALLKRLRPQGLSQGVPTGGTQPAGAGSNQPSQAAVPAAAPSPSFHGTQAPPQPRFSPSELKKLEKLPPKLRALVEEGEMSLDEVTAAW